MIRIYNLLILFSLFLASCVVLDNKPDEKKKKEASKKESPLPSWNEGDTKSRLIQFVESSVDSKKKDLCPKMIGLPYLIMMELYG